jgi:hypothetical protein
VTARAGLVPALAAAVALAACGDRADAPPPEPTIGGRPASEYHIARDAFLAADDPATVGAAEAVFLAPDDEVFGVVVEGRARAYPVPMIAYHHVVNDAIEGVPIAVTY